MYCKRCIAFVAYDTLCILTNLPSCDRVPRMSKNSFRESALRAISIIGLVAILILGAWGIIQLVVGFSDFWGGYSTSTTMTQKDTAEHLTITTPVSLTSDQPFTLSWADPNSAGKYAYTISYACSGDLAFAAPTPAGQMRIVPCHTPFNFTNATDSVQLIPVLHTKNSMSTTFTVEARRLSDNTSIASSTSAVTSVTPLVQTMPSAPTTSLKPITPTQKPTNTSSHVSRGRTTNLYGSADLVATILSITPDSTGRYQARFVISNKGTNVATRGWDFYAQLPLDPTYTFVSQSQQALYPGDKVVYTLGFDAPTNNGYGYPSNTFSVTADPQNLIPEIDKSNNTASATIGY